MQNTSWLKELKPPLHVVLWACPNKVGRSGQLCVYTMKYARPNCCVTRASSIFAKLKISPLTLGSLAAIWQALVCSYLLRFREQRRKSGVVLGERPAHCPDSLISPYNVSKGNEADHSVPAWVVGTLPQKILVSRVTRKDTKILGIYPLLFFCVCVCWGPTPKALKCS